MSKYEDLYFLKDNPKFAVKHLNDFLLFQIYSVPVIRAAYCRWPELPSLLKENTPPTIKELIDKSHQLPDKKLQKKLNQYHIETAISVLKSYQNCGVPLTNDPTVKQTRRKLTTKIGDKNLKILEQAQEKGIYSNKMADLAVRCAHKFLFDSKNYRSWHITSQIAKALTQSRRPNEYTFPSIQLTKGCENHCSHCCDRAEPHLSHMPWPVFVNLCRAFHKHYRHYSKQTCDHYFVQFFADSDMLSYNDPIMGMDAGDFGLWISQEKGATCQYLTRGVRNDKSVLALKKVILSKQPIAISFVDTPKENMDYNIKQLNNTLDVFESFPNRECNPSILHLHMKSEPTVSDEIFRGFPVEKWGIWAMGRGKDLPANETEHWPDHEFIAPHIIAPNGDILLCKIENGENVKEKVNCLYGVPPQHYKKSLWQKLGQLFTRQR